MLPDATTTGENPAWNRLVVSKMHHYLSLLRESIAKLMFTTRNLALRRFKICMLHLYRQVLVMSEYKTTVLNK